MHKIEIVDPSKYADWDEMLLHTPGGSFFHSASWAMVLGETYGYNPFYFAVIERDRFRALVPVMEVNSFLTGKRGVSLPYTDYCEPIITEGIFFPDVLDIIIQWANKRKWSYLELRGGERYLLGTSPSSIYLDHDLDLLEDEEKIFARFRPSTKRNIKKAVREGVEVEISQTLQSIQIFQ